MHPVTRARVLNDLYALQEKVDELVLIKCNPADMKMFPVWQTQTDAMERLKDEALNIALVALPDDVYQLVCDIRKTISDRIIDSCAEKEVQGARQSK